MTYPPTYNGQQIFGSCCRVTHTPSPNQQQIDTFFGLTGQRWLFAGGRGRVFMIQGVLFGADVATLNADEALILSYADGIGRVFTDSRGRAWPQVVFKGEFSPDPLGPQVAVSPAGVGWAMGYKCVLYGLI